MPREIHVRAQSPDKPGVRAAAQTALFDLHFPNRIVSFGGAAFGLVAAGRPPQPRGSVVGKRRRTALRTWTVTEIGELLRQKIGSIRTPLDRLLGNSDQCGHLAMSRAMNADKIEDFARLPADCRSLLHPATIRSEFGGGAGRHGDTGFRQRRFGAFLIQAASQVLSSQLMCRLAKAKKPAHIRYERDGKPAETSLLKTCYSYHKAK